MFNVLKEIALVARWDLMKLTNQKVFLAMRVTWFTIQILVFARVISLIVRKDLMESIGISDYYKFYLLGVYTSLLYTTAVSRGYIVAEEFDDGIVEYHLSLPVKRSVLAVGRVLGSGLSALLFTMPMMALVYAVIEAYNPVLILISIISAAAFAIGTSCFVILIVMTIRSTDLTDILIGAIDATLIRLSTIFYPLPIIASIQPYYVAALLNPLSHQADFLRILIFPEYELVFKHGVLPSILYIVGFVAGLLILAIEFYEKRLEAGGWK